MPSDGHASRRWLGDILYNIILAQDFAGHLTYQEFGTDTLRLYAVIRCLEVISEASRRLPDDLKIRNPEIPWREVAAAGNIYRHDYEAVAARLVWRTLTHDLPMLRLVVEREIAS
ncbi:DUF86 domain-containing protein [Acidisoma sp.]|uniref:HepT-like ribonuclease domain-containing protein n=1 Tax=Acidisoma sp. TaxID=1872115 RepID=UPI003AFFB773